MRQFHTRDLLTSFLYSLMRDTLPVGELEALVQMVEKEAADTEACVFTNGPLAEYALELSQRLQRLSDQKPGDRVLIYWGFNSLMPIPDQFCDYIEPTLEGLLKHHQLQALLQKFPDCVLVMERPAYPDAFALRAASNSANPAQIFAYLGRNIPELPTWQWPHGNYPAVRTLWSKQLCGRE